MKELFTPLIDKKQWMAELHFDDYNADQQNQLWDLVTRGLETQILDTLLDQLNQKDQQALIQHLSEPELQPQLTSFLDQKVPKHQALLEASIQSYKTQLKRDLERLVKAK